MFGVFKSASVFNATIIFLEWFILRNYKIFHPAVDYHHNKVLIKQLAKSLYLNALKTS